MEIYDLLSEVWHWVYLHQTSLASWLTVTILALTFASTIFIETLKGRRRLTLLSHEIIRDIQTISRGGGPMVDEKWSRLEFAFSNSSRRPIKLIRFDVTTYSGHKPKDLYFYGEVNELHEGNHGSGQATFVGWLKKYDLKTITLLDSIDESHEFHFYNDKWHYAWTIIILRFLDWYFRKFGI